MVDWPLTVTERRGAGGLDGRVLSGWLQSTTTLVKAARQSRPGEEPVLRPPGFGEPQLVPDSDCGDMTPTNPSYFPRCPRRSGAARRGTRDEFKVSTATSGDL